MATITSSFKICISEVHIIFMILELTLPFFFLTLQTMFVCLNFVNHSLITYSYFFISIYIHIIFFYNLRLFCVIKLIFQVSLGDTSACATLQSDFNFKFCYYYLGAISSSKINNANSLTYINTCSSAGILKARCPIVLIGLSESTLQV